MNKMRWRNGTSRQLIMRGYANDKTIDVLSHAATFKLRLAHINKRKTLPMSSIKMDKLLNVNVAAVTLSKMLFINNRFQNFCCIQLLRSDESLITIFVDMLNVLIKIPWKT